LRFFFGSSKLRLFQPFRLCGPSGFFRSLENPQDLQDESCATCSAALGDRDEAFRQMQMACTEGERFLRPAQVDPPFDPLRGDPRFQNLLRCPPPPGN
jgi:hypothetical protein